MTYFGVFHMCVPHVCASVIFFVVGFYNAYHSTILNPHYSGRGETYMLGTTFLPKCGDGVPLIIMAEG